VGETNTKKTMSRIKIYIPAFLILVSVVFVVAGIGIVYAQEENATQETSESTSSANPTAGDVLSATDVQQTSETTATAAPEIIDRSALDNLTIDAPTRVIDSTVISNNSQDPNFDITQCVFVVANNDPCIIKKGLDKAQLWEKNSELTWAMQTVLDLPDNSPIEALNSDTLIFPSNDNKSLIGVDLVNNTTFSQSMENSDVPTKIEMKNVIYDVQFIDGKLSITNE